MLIFTLNHLTLTDLRQFFIWELIAELKMTGRFIRGHKFRWISITNAFENLVSLIENYYFCHFFLNINWIEFKF